jgi:putative transposase
MPRGSRVIVPQVAVHVVQRGHDRRDCFQHDTDCLVYLASLRELLATTGCALHAYCLMTNHVHLLLTPPTEIACASLMRNVGQRYVQYFNRRYQRSGTLWEGRFRSCLVDSAEYVVACHRYIELNPVRAGMARFPSDYRWSSYGGNGGLAPNRLLTPHAEYLALANDEASRYQTYRSLFASGDDAAFLKSIRDATNGGYAVVGERLRSALPPDIRRRLERRPPGPQTKAAPQRDKPLAQLEFELGLRPRTS